VSISLFVKSGELSYTGDQTTFINDMHVNVARNCKIFDVFELSNAPTIRLHLTTFFRKEIVF
jgi:hypothetical protein